MTDTQLLDALTHLSMSVIARGPDAIYLRLPAALQRDCGGCSCDYCKAHPEHTPTWDTLAIPMHETDKRNDTSWTVHMPDPKTALAYWASKERKPMTIDRVLVHLRAQFHLTRSVSHQDAVLRALTLIAEIHGPRP